MPDHGIINKQIRQKIPFSLADKGILLWIIAVGVILSQGSSRFLEIQNLMNILSQSSVIGILSIGMTFVIISGNDGIDLSVGSIIGISSVTMALFLFPENQSAASGFFDIAKAIMVALSMGALCGFINGLLIATVKLPPFIATLSMMTIAKGISAFISTGKPTYGLPSAIVYLGQGKILGIPFPILFMTILGCIGIIILRKTIFGMSVFAIGGNKTAVYLSGVDVKKLQIIIYTLNGLMAGIAAIVLSGRVNQLHPESGMGYEMYAIGAVCDRWHIPDRR